MKDKFWIRLRRTVLVFSAFVLVAAIATAATANVRESATGKRNNTNDGGQVDSKRDYYRSTGRRVTGTPQRKVVITTTTRKERPRLQEVDCWGANSINPVSNYAGKATRCYVPTEAISNAFFPFEYDPGKLVRITDIEVSNSLETTTVPMPVPDPVMNSPVGYCGMPVQLDLRIPEMINVLPTQTNVGELTGFAWGEFFIDWGDGKTETVLQTGAPFPFSELRHVYKDRGNYKIDVTATWYFDWSLAQFNGQIPRLITNGSIPSFEIREAQAVLVSN